MHESNFLDQPIQEGFKAGRETGQRFGQAQGLSQRHRQERSFG